jgi:malonyl-CoA/methylmalonyl-CoA synthetase
VPPELPLFARARTHRDRTAVVATDGTFTYGELLSASERVAAALLAGADDLRDGRVALLAAPGLAWVAAQWGIWRAGGIAVPLAVSHPPPEHEYLIRDCGAALVLASPEFVDSLAPAAAACSARLMPIPRALTTAPCSPLPPPDESRRAMIVYTSGTTGRPKGVVLTHAHLAAQVTSLVTAWEWDSDDRILLVLPLHHVHGIVNVVACALWSGATCEMAPRFDAVDTWERMGGGGFTLFMAVPTIYHRLLSAWDAAPAERQRRWSEGARRLRLMVSGSAALPRQTLDRWREITGHTLLERYGMTEIGMALSQPLRGERVPGCVGAPLPGVAVRIVDDRGAVVPPGTPGELEVRGPGVFTEYWGRPADTAAAFRDGWFRTGDVAVLDGGDYRLLGRTSVDFIKTGGFKVSALEIEEVLRDHPAIAECAVVGVDDAEWGQRVAVGVELADGHTLAADELIAWAAERLAPYKVPRAMMVVARLPRNAMGKVTKREVAALFPGGGSREEGAG